MSDRPSYLELKEQGLCTQCCEPNPTKFSTCDSCREKHRKSCKKYYDKNKERGTCVHCGGNKEDLDLNVCNSCRKIKRKCDKDYYQKKCNSDLCVICMENEKEEGFSTCKGCREAQRLKVLYIYREENDLTICKVCGSRSGLEICEHCQEFVEDVNDELLKSDLCIVCLSNKRHLPYLMCAPCKKKWTHTRANTDYRRRIKEQVFSHYGNKCVTCGEAEILFLQIDHINEDGWEIRKNNRDFLGTKLYKWIIDNNFPKNLQLLCANCNRKKNKEYKRSKHKNTETAIASRKSYNKRRKAVIDHYGGKCACCGIEDIDVLEFDHINGGGHKHFRKEGINKLMNWLYKNDYPEGFQVLCSNCNVGKHLNGGTCPHQDK